MSDNKKNFNKKNEFRHVNSNSKPKSNNNSDSYKSKSHRYRDERIKKTEFKTDSEYNYDKKDKS